jgi:hypothetical protein
MDDQVSHHQISASHREQAPGQNPQGDRFGTDALLRCLPLIHRKLLPIDSRHYDEEEDLPAPNILLGQEGIDNLCATIKSLRNDCLASAENAMMPERQALRNDIAALCLETNAGYFASFHKLQETYFALAPLYHELRKLVPDDRSGSPNPVSEGISPHHVVLSLYYPCHHYIFHKYAMCSLVTRLYYLKSPS